MILFNDNFCFCCRFEKLVSGAKKIESDGLNSLKYETRTIERKVLYTWILADVKPNSVK